MGARRKDAGPVTRTARRRHTALLGALLAAGCASAPADDEGDQPPRLGAGARSEMRRTLQREYRASGLMAQGVEGTTTVWMFVDEEGLVDDVRVHTSSGNPALDEVAMRIARTQRWEPSRRDGEPRAVWVTLSYSFSCDTTPMPVSLIVPRPVGPARGEAAVSILVDATGRVREARIEGTSGSSAFDQAVLDAVRNNRFHPGTVDCKPAQMWTTMRFRAGRGRRPDARGAEPRGRGTPVPNVTLTLR